jgi:hypothetical protein
MHIMYIFVFVFGGGHGNDYDDYNQSSPRSLRAVRTDVEKAKSLSCHCDPSFSCFLISVRDIASSPVVTSTVATPPILYRESTPPLPLL